MYQLFIWDDKYLTGVSMVDTQHKQLFEYINSCYSAISTKESKETITKTLNGLIDYTIYHFREEEKMMNSVKGYDSSAHIQMHKSFCAKIGELKAKAFLGDEVSYDLVDFMKDWLITHIMQVDQKLGKAYKANK